MDSGGTDIQILLVIVIIIAAIAAIVWLLARDKEDRDVYEEPEKDSHVMPGADKETETGRASGTAKKSGERPSGDAAKKDAGLAYGRGMAKGTKKQAETEEKEWESVIIYSYYGRKDIWRCAYCDGENLCSDTVCHLCGKKKAE